MGEAGHGAAHVAHEQRGGQLAQVGVEKGGGGFGRGSAALHQQGRYFGGNEEGLGQITDLSRVGFGDIIPALTSGYGHLIRRRNDFKSTTKPRPAPAGLPLKPAPLPAPAMNKLQEFYRKYRQYIGTDALMYGVFIVVLALMFVFFG
ncbi:hypothetical protein GCM10022407_02090 [Hymenobacter antarcticus]|uniref:Uncharacterized protein n=1 Tax=Hymenobacter antarcticus TaxID=486270 RepID=A0ABP7P2T7_9BACT